VWYLWLSNVIQKGGHYMKRIKIKPRNVNMDTIRLDNGTFLYPGDSIATEPCPNWLRRRMEFNIRQNARRSNVVFPLRQKVAREMLEEHNIPFIRLTLKQLKAINESNN